MTSSPDRFTVNLTEFGSDHLHNSSQVLNEKLFSIIVMNNCGDKYLLRYNIDVSS